MSDPGARVSIDEYMVACYGTTEYTEDMKGIRLYLENGRGTVERELDYEYRCREERLAGAACAGAIVPQIRTAVSMRCSDPGAEGYIKEGYAFSPMFTLGYEKPIREKEVLSTWLSLERAD